MQIEREDDWHLRSDHFTQPPKKFSVSIRIGNAHGRAVQRDEQCIHWQILPHGIQQLGNQPLVCVFGQSATGNRERCHAGHGG
jgi:hypothetical protein